MYWHIGKRIFEEEQQGKELTDYGTFLTEYIAYTIKTNCTAHQLERQIYSSLYEHLLLSNDKESVLAIAKNKKQFVRGCIIPFLLAISPARME